MMISTRAGCWSAIVLPRRSPNDSCRRVWVVLLDEWLFDESILSLPVQLLWLEGKPVPLPQPQNTGAIGHKLYNGSAPIFITTKMQYLEKLVREAGAAEAADESSVIA